MGKAILGLIMILAGIVLGLYVGVWVCFIGGILDIVHVCVAIFNHAAFSYLTIGWGILKIVLASIAGFVSAMMLMVPGIAMIDSAK